MTNEEKKLHLLDNIKDYRLRQIFEKEYATKDIDTVNDTLEHIVELANMHYRRTHEFPISLNAIKSNAIEGLNIDFNQTSQTRFSTDNFADGHDLFLLSIDDDMYQTDGHGYNARMVTYSPMFDTLKLYRYAVSQPDWLNLGNYCVLALDEIGCLFDVILRVIAHNKGYSTWTYMTEDECDCYDLVSKSHKEEYHLNDDIVYKP